MRLVPALLTIGSTLALATAAAQAGDNVECYSSAGTWNVPRAAIAFNRSQGSSPVASVVTGVGEWWTHTVSSHGPDQTSGGWASMATAREPRTYPDGASSCGAPVEPNDLANGWPGERTDSQGGLWSFYFSNGGFMNGQTQMSYIVPGTGSQYNNGVANTTYGNDAQVAQCLTDWEKARLSGSSGCGSGSPGPGCGGPIPYGYSVYAYSQYQNNPSGHGTMCSGLIGWAYYNGTNASGSYCDPNSISQYTYSNAQVVNASNALYNNINSNGQSFFQSVGTFFACFDGNLMDEAGDQAVDCFTVNQGTSCTMSNHDWAGNNVYGHTASSISPDRIAGQGVHYASNNNSPWEPYAYNTVQFNQPGNNYACWY